MRLALVGSREFLDYDMLCKVVAKVHTPITCIVTGCARGADALARRYARLNGYPLSVHYADWDRLGKRAGHERNGRVIGDADAVIAFPMGKSVGTYNAIGQAEALGIPVYIVPVDEIMAKQEAADKAAAGEPIIPERYSAIKYTLYDAENNVIDHGNLQAKGAWCESGARKEEVFVAKHGDALNLIINPEKTTSPYVPDLFNTRTKALGDLKTQNTPFFQATSRYGLDAQYAVVFNQKDAERYARYYPDIEIYFWVDWVVMGFKGVTEIAVQPMTGVWYIPFRELQKLLGIAPLHSYAQRTNDTQGNAKGSYVLDLRNSAFQKVV